MNILDILLVIPLSWGAYKGFRKGFFHEIAVLAGLVAGIFLAAILADTTGRIMEALVDWNTIPVKIIVFVIVFILVVMLFQAVGKLLERIFKAIRLNIINRLAGMCLGILKYAFVLSLLFIFINYLHQYIPVLSDTVKDGSYLYELIEPLAPMVIPEQDLIKLPESLTVQTAELL
jgi:membrane protein required for colicin V production